MIAGAKKITKIHPYESLEKEAKDLHYPNWEADSFQLSENFVYNGIEYGDYPSEAYMKRGGDVCEKQLALGGYRLANLMIKVIEAQKSEEPKEKTQ